jgi:hypothetical protein
MSNRKAKIGLQLAQLKRNKNSLKNISDHLLLIYVANTFL